MHKSNKIIIYAFDFINGAGAVIVTPDNEKELLSKSNLRKWMVYYMAGYCAFWHTGNWEWLYNVVDKIIKGELSKAGIKTAGYLKEKLMGDINAGRKVNLFSEILSLRKFRIACCW